jgi:hypothetical protein
MDDILVWDGGIINSQISHKSPLSEKSDTVELLINKASRIATTRAERKQKYPIVRNSPSVTQELVEEFCQDNPLFKEICDRISRLRKLINLQLLSSIQDIPPSCLEVWLDDWITLGKRVNRATAIQLISNLPASLRVIELAALSDSDKKALEKQKFAVLLYKLSGSWLWAWEEENFNIPANIKSCYEPFEPLAFLSESRYRLIRGLFDKEKINKDLFPRPAFAWVLSEAAFCRRLFQNNLQKDDLYQCWKLYIELLSNLDNPLKRKQLKGLPDLIPSIDLIFDRLAREQAKFDDDFAEKYFEPYIESLKRWNARTRTGKAVAIPQFDNPDPPKRPRTRKK